MANKILSFLFILFISVINISYAANHKFISYTDVGQGKPLVLIHAFPTDLRLWAPQQELKDHFRVISIDLWGFGRSAAADGSAITMTEYADEVKQLLDQLKIHKAVIAGESMGGYIALAFLQKYAANVEGLILSDTQTIADSAETKAKREANAVDILEHGSDQFILNFMPKALSSQAPENTRNFLFAIIKQQYPPGIASALRGMALRVDTSQILANTDKPVLIITGNMDVLISPEQSTNMHKLAKNSRLIVINNAGHLSSLEQPEQWNKAVVEMF